MTPSSERLSPADAARRLGISAKALRLYEDRGLIAPGRTQAGWRVYGSAELERASAIVSLRALGLSLAQIARVMSGDAHGLGPALAAHQAVLEGRLHDLSGAIARVHAMRDRIASGAKPDLAELTSLQTVAAAPAVAFDLPWPWGGERFELPILHPLTWITGPLFSGKTQLALALASHIPGAVFVGLDRAVPDDEVLLARIAPTLEWLLEDGATRSTALIALLCALDGSRDNVVVIDLIEQGLDEATQLAVSAYLRKRESARRPIFAMTRSTAMLDLSAVSAHETIILCPANHSPPVFVAPHPGAPGYEAVASCLAAPDVRARSEGVVAMRTNPPRSAQRNS